MSATSITITREEVVAFYNQHEGIDVDEVNLFFINIIKQLKTNMSTNINDANIAKIVRMVTDVGAKLDSFDNGFSLKLMELKNNYVDSIKDVLSATSLTETAAIQNTLERNQDTLLAKTSVLLNEFIPHTQHGYVELERIITSHYAAIHQTAKSLVVTQSATDDSSAKVFSAIDEQFGKMIGQVHQPICTFIQQSDERTRDNLRQLDARLGEQQQNHQMLTSEMNAFLNKYKNNSSSKGAVSESELYSLLQSIMPTDEIIRCASETAACDIRVNRADSARPTILFENKNYARSVDTEEIAKFERDVATQKQHGIFLSQASPIVFKDTFHIDIINGLILVYIPNANYDGEKIRVAVSIIDHLAPQLAELARESRDASTDGGAGNRTISTVMLNAVIKEYTEFGLKKIEAAELVKTMTKQFTDKLDEMQFPSLTKFLLGTGQFRLDKFSCPHCSFGGKNKSSLSAHMRTCKKPAIAPPPVPPSVVLPAASTTEVVATFPPDITVDI